MHRTSGPKWIRLALALCLAAGGAKTGAVTSPGWVSSASGVRAVIIKSSADGAEQSALFYAPPQAKPGKGGGGVPLLVSLHSWSATFDNYDSLQSTLGGCVKKGWIFISPDFRGPNLRPEAAGSDLAVQDVLDAVAFARRQAPVDEGRIYLMGASGGGHMGLLMACRAPGLWAGVSVACPITDLPGWYRFCEEGKFRYADMMKGCFGGPPDVPERGAEYRRRSPLFCLDAVAGVPIDIQTGILDGHAGRAVPVDHALRAFNALLEANGMPDKELSPEEIGFITREARLPSSLTAETEDEPGRKYPILFRRDAGIVRLTLYDAGHDFDSGLEGTEPPALAWLEKQRRAAPPAPGCVKEHARRAPDEGPVGYWKLSADARDFSGNNRHGESRNIKYSPQGYAEFNGRDGYIEIPYEDALDLGAGEFTVSAWVDIGTSGDDNPGDILNQFDPAKRRGINLGVKTLQGVTVAQSNTRNVEFGIDNARLEPEWRDCGRPGNAVFVFALSVYRGDLYAGTYEEGRAERGHVFRYKGGQEWEDCGSPDGSNSVISLAVYRDKLYAGTGFYPASGSALPDSENTTPGGRVFRYEGGKYWVDCGGPKGVKAVGAMAVFKDRLYTGPSKAKGVYVYDGEKGWAPAGTPGDARSFTLAAFNGDLWSGGDVYIEEERGGVFRSGGGGEWSFCGRPGIPPGVKSMQLYSFQAYQGRLHIGVWPTAEILRYEGGTSWTSLGRPGEEKETMAVAVYNGMFYVGTLPLAKVFRYDGANAWTDLGQLDKTPDVKYRRAWSMAVFRGRLFCGTLPSGHVFSREAGKCLTYDHELPAGWHHIAAVKRSDRLELFIDGRRVAQSSAFDPKDFNLPTGRPLRIGSGQHDFFCGRMKDLKIWRRALKKDEIEAISSSRIP
jgi:pimeloyl-ACP methyl ester carboxylesterase